MSELKLGWRRVKFGELAECINDRVDDPAQAGVDRYVGLEHLDPESLTIRRWGSPEDVESTKLRFQPGDIIFGKRRAYQRKLAVADFEGICSAHAMVLRARSGAVLPAFLPFFMQSDLFMERAVAISVGSLSPTINWKTLAVQEFALPPLEEQRRIAKVAGASDAVWQTLKGLQTAAAVAEAAVVEDFVSRSRERTPIAKVITDISYGCSAKSTADPLGLPILRIPNVLRGALDLSDLQWLDLQEEDDLERFGVNAGDVLLVRTNGNPEYVGRSVVVPSGQQPMLFASYLLRLRVREEILPEFLSAMLNAASTRRALRGRVSSSAGNYNINTVGVREQRIPFCDLEAQQSLVARLETLRNSQLQLEKTTLQMASLHRRILETGLK